MTLNTCFVTWSTIKNYLIFISWLCWHLMVLFVIPCAVELSTRIGGGTFGDHPISHKVGRWMLPFCVLVNDPPGSDLAANPATSLSMPTVWLLKRCSVPLVCCQIGSIQGKSNRQSYCAHFVYWDTKHCYILSIACCSSWMWSLDLDELHSSPRFDLPSVLWVLARLIACVLWCSVSWALYFWSFVHTKVVDKTFLNTFCSGLVKQRCFVLWRELLCTFAVLCCRRWEQRMLQFGWGLMLEV